MEGAPVVPDGDVVCVVVLILAPLEAALEVVVLGDVFEEEFEHAVRFVLRELVDAAREEFVDEQAPPARDWVGADHGVDGDQLPATVLGCATLLAELEAVALGDFCEARVVVGCRKAFQGGAEGGGEAVVCLYCKRSTGNLADEAITVSYLVCRGPEGISASLGEGGHLQDRVFSPSAWCQIACRKWGIRGIQLTHNRSESPRR